MADARMHPRQFTYCPIGERFGRRCRGVPSCPPGLLPGRKCAREIPGVVITDAKIGLYSHAPRRARVFGDEGNERFGVIREIMGRAGRITESSNRCVEVLIFATCRRLGGDKRLLQPWNIAYRG